MTTIARRGWAVGVLSFSGAVACGQTLVVPPNQATQTLTEFQRETQRRVWEMSAPKGARREVVVAFAATNAAGYERAAQMDQAPKPDYPTETVAAARSGTVKLDVAIDAQGNVREPRLVGSVHDAFAGSAIATVLDWKFAPALKQGKPAASRGVVTVEFRVIADREIVQSPTFAIPRKSPKEYPAEYRYDEAPQLLVQRDPVYPVELFAGETSGSADMVFLIDPAGRPRRVEVKSTTHPAFGAAATAAIAAWRFTPAKKAGKPTWTMLATKQVFGFRDAVGKSTFALWGEANRQSSAIAEGFGQLDARPALRYQVGPVIPDEVIAAKAPAEAEIECVIDAAGRVQLPRVISATRPDFGAAAAQAVASWQFAPPLKGGKPVAVKVRVPLGYEPPVLAAK